MSRYSTLCTIIAVFALHFSVFAAIPEGYYSSLNGKASQALKTQISNITLQHTQLEYNSLWRYFHSTDVRPDTEGKVVWDMYSAVTYYFSTNINGSTIGMNREHSFPKSWWGGDVNAAYTDLNHLYPADGPANMAKSNYPLGTVSQATFDNGVTKVGYPVTGEGGGCGYVFEPGDEYKGDFARTYFYMACTYQNYTWKPLYSWMLTNSGYLTLKPWAYNLLLKWSREDPISQKELDRNEAVYLSQGNRNPFIDDPDLAEYIWGNKMGQNYYVFSGGTSGKPAIVTPAVNSNINFGEVALGKTNNLEVYIKGENLTGNLTVTIYGTNASFFTSPVTIISSSIANSENGYKLILKYAPTELGQHNARLLFSDGGLAGSVSAALSGECLAVPSLSPLIAYNAEKLSDSGYRASWEVAPEEIDYYLITRTIYENGAIKSSAQYNSDDTYYEFNDYTPDTKETYYVQSFRLGYLSQPSNVITYEAQSGISDAMDSKALALANLDGGILFICNETVPVVKIYNLQGQMIKYFPEVSPNETLMLPQGMYIINSPVLTRPIKFVVK